MRIRLLEKLNGQWTHQLLAVLCWGPDSDGDRQHLHLAHRKGNAWAVFRKDKARTLMRSLFLWQEVVPLQAGDVQRQVHHVGLEVPIQPCPSGA